MSEAAIGRSMNQEEIDMAYFLAGGLRSGRLLNADMSADIQPILARRDDLFVAGKALFDDGVAALDRPGGDLAHGSRSGGIDNVDEEAVLSPLKRCGRNGHGLLERLLLDPQRHELTGPERIILVLKNRFDADRAACLIDFVVDERERA